MPARSRPTARLLTPAGWIGVLTLVGAALAIALACLAWLPRP